MLGAVSYVFAQADVAAGFLGVQAPVPLTNIDAGVVCVLDASFDFLNKIFQLQLDFDKQESLNVKFKFLSNDTFKLNAELDHIKILNYDLSTELVGNGKIARDSQGSPTHIEGKVQAKYSLLNYKPLKEMKGSFKLDNSGIDILDFVWGDIEIDGTVKFASPQEMDLDVVITDMDVNELATFLGFYQKDLIMTGLVDGEINIKGKAPSFYIKGRIRAQDGNFDELNFEKAIINFAGIYPLMHIVDSGIVEKNGFAYVIDGSIDLEAINDFESESHNLIFYQGDSDSFGGQTWVVERKKNYMEDREELELKLSPSPSQPLKFRFKGDEEILGLEHTLKF